MISNNNNAPQSFLGVFYLVAVVWATMKSNKRWLTLLWIVVSLIATVGMFFATSLAWPYLATALGYAAVDVSLLVSALVGISYMRAHRSTAAPKS